MIYNRVSNLRVFLCKPCSQKLLLRTYRRLSPPQQQASSVVPQALRGQRSHARLMEPEVDETPAAKRLRQNDSANDSTQAADAHEARHPGAASSTPAAPASQAEEKQPGRKLSRKEKQLQKDPAKAKSAEIFRGIQMCARSGDLAAAVNYLEQAQVNSCARCSEPGFPQA
ncbi:hypothetical protein DUNSADRAFT_6392 [Dunaliella salina]|uniref:Uncharacterized protein n=1 Tax=Dunaliella salina TaxID=3046 RepID=A0ABQ7H6Q1_DUNSA|nr:hypothetical protein DUNSADRAFT_6392 [Dunaliella salina]|eukprot:KAF5842542.1 hypothetical protein DUNSADRAFT_6392 [Dunaliella salina]